MIGDGFTMLKREDKRDIFEGVSIKIPTLSESNKIIKKLNSLSKDETGEVNYDNPDVIYMLFKKLIVSNIPEIKNITKADFKECYNNPTPEMETICFEIGRVVSDCTKSVLRNNIAQLMETELRLIQAEAVTRLNSISEKAKEINKIEKTINNN